MGKIRKYPNWLDIYSIRVDYKKETLALMKKKEGGGGGGGGGSFFFHTLVS